MTGTLSAEGITKALDSRKPAKAMKALSLTAGEGAVFEALDAYSGDFPDPAKIRRITLALNAPEADLRTMSESENSSVRRISRLLLLQHTAGMVEDAALQKGLSDPSARIRADAARFTGEGGDRTRLYNQLIKLIREDPDARVRAAAGKRLAMSFADLYAVDFDGLPPISRMLILDALGGVTRSDEEKAEALLNSTDGEASFRAARALQRWGTLARIYASGGSETSSVLETAASKGVVEFLEGSSPDDSHRDLAVRLAGMAGRDDLVRAFVGTRSPETPMDDIGLRDIDGIERMIFSLAEKEGAELKKRLGALPLDETHFRHTVEQAFPPPEADRIAGTLFEMAAFGGWTDWAPRIADALENEDPDIRCSAAAALSSLDPAAAAEKLPFLLTDPVDRVRSSAARGLASLAEEGGGGHLAEYLSGAHPEGEKESVLSGVREAGGAALARCIIDNADFLDDAAKGDLMARGMDSVGVELLADGFTTISSLKNAAAAAGPEAGESFLAAWETVDAAARKRLLSWIGASGWAGSLPSRLRKGGRMEKKRIRKLLAPLGPDERHTLFDPVIEGIGGREKRNLKRISRTR